MSTTDTDNKPDIVTIDLDLCDALRTFKLSYGKAGFAFTRQRKRHELVLQLMRLVGDGVRRKI